MPLETVAGQALVQSSIAAIMVEGRKRDGAGKGHVMLRLADIEGGADQDAASSPARRAMISGHSASVPRSPLGPCCSVEPMGIRIALELAR